MNDTLVAQQNKVYDHASRRLHNPKSHAPAIFIPCWLSQLTNKELHYSSKLVYGRLAQWSQANGRAHRSARQLSIEVGMPIRTVERSLSELREKGLIGTFQPIDGGHNHFEFYHHEWMDRQIVRELCYKSDTNELGEDVAPPSAKMALPSAKMAVPSAKMAVHKIKVNKTKYNINKKEKNNKKEKSALQESICTQNKNEHARESAPPLNERENEMIPYQETLYPMPALKETASNGGLAVDKLAEINPHNIPVQMIHDWLHVRRAKRSPVTATAWARLTNQLGKCEDPVEAFEIMVTQGWASFNHAWLANIKGISSAKKQKVDVCEELESDDWINRI